MWRYFIFLFLINFISNQDLVKEQFSILTLEKQLSLELLFGSNKEKVVLAIDINSDKNWMFSGLYDTKNSTTYKSTTTDSYIHDSFKATGAKSTDNSVLSCSGQNLKNLNFVLATKTEGTEYNLGAIGLSKEGSNFISTLKNANKKVPAFSLKFDRFGESGTLFLGEIHQALDLDLTLMHSCKVSGNKWGCELKNVFIGNYPNTISHRLANYDIDTKKVPNFEVKSTAIFETIYNKVIVPSSFMQFLEENYFKDKTFCTKSYDNSSGKTSFFCDYKFMDELTNINFMLDNGLTLYLTSDDLLQCDDNLKCEFVIVSFRDINHWALGIPVLKNYQPIFNIESNQITFYDGTQKFYANAGGKGGVSGVGLFFIWFFVIIGLIAAFLLIRRYIKNKKMILYQDNKLFSNLQLKEVQDDEEGKKKVNTYFNLV